MQPACTCRHKLRLGDACTSCCWFHVGAYSRCDDPAECIRAKQAAKGHKQACMISYVIKQVHESKPLRVY